MWKMDAIGRGEKIMSMKNIWLFGAGKYGAKYIEEYGNAMVKGFVDNSPKCQGAKVQNVPVYGYNEFKRNFDKETDIIYITASRRDEIFEQLFNDGLEGLVKAYRPGGV